MKRITGVAAQSAGYANYSDPVFSEQVIRWQKQHGRHMLPWQNTRDAYRVWLSEIMLQQTQVAAVIPYYERFLQRFPTVFSLAQAKSDEVMAHWSGLGYYTRARNLHRCAQRVVAEYGGVFPSDPQLLADLPGIGRSTAAAIAAFSFGARAAILDGNVKRVFCRVFGIDGFPGDKPVEDALWRRAETLLPDRDMEAYTQGLMDLGATVCTRSSPSCGVCPLSQRCIALASGRVAQLPQRKARKAVPERETVMLAVVHGDRVLLEQRPDSGIWGGLLSLPQIDPGKGMEEASVAIEAAVASFGVPAFVQALLPFTHVFTHFKLHVRPWLVRLESASTIAGEARYAWYETKGIANAALPAPVKKLLLSVFREPDLLS